MLTRLAQSESTTGWFRLWDKVCAAPICKPPSRRCGGTAERPESDEQTVAQFDDERRPNWPGCTNNCGRNATAATGAAGLDPTSRHDREATAGHTGGAGSDRASGVAATFWNRSSRRTLPSTATGFDRGAGAKDALRRVDELLEPGPRLGGGRRPQELLRHHSARPADGAGAAARGATGGCWRWWSSVLKAGVMEELKGWQPTERGTPARGGDQSAAGEPVSQPAGP